MNFNNENSYLVEELLNQMKKNDSFKTIFKNEHRFMDYDMNLMNPIAWSLEKG